MNAPAGRGSLALLWLGAWLLFLCFAHGNLESRDAAMTMHAARALLLRGDTGLRQSGEGAEWLAEGAIADHIARNPGQYGKQGRDGGLWYVWFPIGHVWLMVPCVAVGELLARAFPGAEQRYRRATAPGVADADLAAVDAYRDGQFVLDQGVVALGLPAAFGATSVLLLFLIAQALGGSRREAALTAAAIALGTQFFPLTRETLSDGPGLCCLLAALLAVVRYDRGTGTARTLLLGGAAAGAAVLTRYGHGVLVPLLVVAVVLAAFRRGRLRDALCFCAGGLPFAVLLAAIDHARFGSVGDTGYPPFLTWFDQPPWFGVPKLLVAAGKGILWFSPLVWLALPLAVRRAAVPSLRWLAWGLFLVPMLLFGSTQGWQSGQCWGARYVTPGVVALLVLVLPQARPWQRWPRTFRALLAAGLLVNLTGVLAPTRGHNQLAGQAVEAYYAGQFARGEISQADLAAAREDTADHYFFEWRYSPLHANWTYAWQSLRGAFGDDQAHLLNDAAATIEPLFGVTAGPTAEPDAGLAPLHWEDRGFRHLWFVFWGALLGVPGLVLLLPVALGAVAVLWAVWRRLSRD